MRYIDVDTIEFTDVNGKTYAVKDIRPLEDLTTAIIIPVVDGLMLDEVASRPDVFGIDQEGLTYKFLDLNAEKLTEQRFEVNNLVRLRVPNL